MYVNEYKNIRKQKMVDLKEKYSNMLNLVQRANEGGELVHNWQDL